MDWTWYLFRFDGRINRAKIWLALLVSVCWAVFLMGLIVGVRVLAGGPATFEVDAYEFLDPATYRALSLSTVPMLGAKLLLAVLFTWVWLATSIKRLYDRDRSGWWMLPFFILPSLYGHYGDRLPDSVLDIPLGLLAIALSIWGFVELYMLRGSRQTNRFGADPIAEIRDRMQATRTAAWDQRDELEFVPSSASPPDGMHVKRGA
jgi:uncharacterized membrane protein YhaH (DUF805 family)